MINSKLAFYYGGDKYYVTAYDYERGDDGLYIEVAEIETESGEILDFNLKYDRLLFMEAEITVAENLQEEL